MERIKIVIEPNLRALDKIDAVQRKRLKGLMPDEKIESGLKIVRNEVLQAWADGDIERVLAMLDNTYELAFVADNHHALRKMGVYEKGLLSAYQATRINNSNVQKDVIQFLFNFADPEKLRAAGDDIPEQAEYILYRGVAGNTRARRAQGHSWTDSIETAAWFAMRYKDLKDPAVFKVVVPFDSILAKLDGRNESEYLLRLPLPVKQRRIPEDLMKSAYQRAIELKRRKSPNSIA